MLDVRQCLYERKRGSLSQGRWIISSFHVLVFVSHRRWTWLERLHRANLTQLALIVFHQVTMMKGFPTVNHTIASNHWRENCHVLDWLHWKLRHSQEGACWSWGNFLDQSEGLHNHLSQPGREKRYSKTWYARLCETRWTYEEVEKVRGYCWVFLAVSVGRDLAAWWGSTDSVSTNLGYKYRNISNGGNIYGITL